MDRNHVCGPECGPSLAEMAAAEMAQRAGLAPTATTVPEVAPRETEGGPLAHSLPERAQGTFAELVEEQRHFWREQGVELSNDLMESLKREYEKQTGISTAATPAPNVARGETEHPAHLPDLRCPRCTVEQVSPPPAAPSGIAWRYDGDGVYVAGPPQLFKHGDGVWRLVPEPPPALTDAELEEIGAKWTGHGEVTSDVWRLLAEVARLQDGAAFLAANRENLADLWLCWQTCSKRFSVCDKTGCEVARTKSPVAPLLHRDNQETVSPSTCDGELRPTEWRCQKCGDFV